MRARMAWPLLAVLMFTVSSCDNPTDIAESNEISLKKISPHKEACYDPDDPHCLPGPPPDDPDPNAPGYYIGADYNMDFCTVSNDIDDDGFDDNCEHRIASRFKPLLATNPSDDVSREPHWVATYRSSLPGGGGEGVEIMYLFSYHVDLGKDLGPPVGVVGAHSGDSEFVVLRIVFDDTSEHWMLQSAFYAAHHNATGDSDYEGNYTRFEYPDVNRGYPRVWVAHDKHGSYRSKSACNRGGVAKADDCTYNYDDERVEVLESRNLGSGTQGFLNCVYSENPVSYPGTECFWDISHFDYTENKWVGYEFCGWDLDRSSCAGGYGPALAEFNFRSYPSQ